MGLLLAAALLAGCKSPSEVFLQPQGGTALAQGFSRVCITQSGDGEYDVVAVEDGLDRIHRQKGVLRPQAAAPLRQVLHLHLFWRPREGKLRNNPAATNAAIEWYVIGGESDAAGDSEGMLRYQGAGLVTLHRAGDAMHVVIHNGNLQLAERRGALIDPIGPAGITGQVYAHPHDAEVAQTLAELEQQRTASR